MDRDENVEMDETTIKSIDNSRPSDFRLKAVAARTAVKEMISEIVAESSMHLEGPDELPNDKSNETLKPKGRTKMFS